MKTKGLTAAISLLLSLSATAASAGNYTVKGNIEGHGGRILLLRPTSMQTADTIANVITPDGNFHIEGQAGAPCEAELRVPESGLRIPLFLEDGAEITINSPAGEKGWTASGGGQLQQCRNRFRQLELDAAAGRDSINNYYRSTYDMDDYFWVIQLKGALEQHQDSYEKAEDEFIAANDNMVSASIIAQRAKSLSRSKKIHKKFALLGPNARQSERAKMLEPLARLSASTSVGGIAPDFTMSTPDGGSITLHGIKAKVKILDFWASWCGPCRAENPNLRKIYGNFHDKGLEIISVSLDTEKDLWLKAIAKDGMEWLHASDLDKAGTARNIYNVYAIPYMLILDENNRIISEGLRGEKLEEFINSRL